MIFGESSVLKPFPTIYLLTPLSQKQDCFVRVRMASTAIRHSGAGANPPSNIPIYSEKSKRFNFVHYEAAIGRWINLL